MTQNTSNDGAKSLTFEQALDGLEEVVARLEGGEIGLEESLKDFEQGVELLRAGYALLERAEQRIELLTGFDEQGRPQTEPFDATATVEKQAAKKRVPGESGLFEN